MSESEPLRRLGIGNSDCPEASLRLRHTGRLFPGQISRFLKEFRVWVSGPPLKPGLKLEHE